MLAPHIEIGLFLDHGVLHRSIVCVLDAGLLHVADADRGAVSDMSQEGNEAERDAGRSDPAAGHFAALAPFKAGHVGQDAERERDQGEASSVKVAQRRAEFVGDAGINRHGAEREHPKELAELGILAPLLLEKRADADDERGEGARDGLDELPERHDLSPPRVEDAGQMFFARKPAKPYSHQAPESGILNPANLLSAMTMRTRAASCSSGRSWPMI